MDRLTGGVGHMQPPPPQQQQPNQRPPPIVVSGSTGLRNESYYMATNDMWSPINLQNTSVLIEEDPEPVSP